MATKRPCFSSTGLQLLSLFEDNKLDYEVLREIKTELEHRSTPTAQSLLLKVGTSLASFIKTEKALVARG